MFIRSAFVRYSCALILVQPLAAQLPPRPGDAMWASVQAGSGYMRDMITRAADQMTAEDYMFRPTPDVRSFGELLAHIAENNYRFCSIASGETAPARDAVPSQASRVAIQRVLTESFAYCDEVHRTIDPSATHTVEFGGSQRSPTAVLNFRVYHGLLHYGNVITYMRLRGKVPPSSEPVSDT